MKLMKELPIGFNVGEVFSSYKKESFDESRILFAYEELQPSAQEAFLDICSFFFGWEWEEVACIVGEEELESLEEGALLKRIELDEGYDVKRKVLPQIKGVWLGWNRKSFHVSAEKLDRMCGSLRVFAIGDSIIVKGKCHQQFNELRFLQVGRVPNIPFDISKLKRLTFMDDNSEENMVLNLSKKLNLSFCQDLKELPDSLEKLCSLKELDLRYCRNLNKLPAGFGELKALTNLDLTYCEILQELPGGYEKLSSLRSLSLEHCSSLIELHERIGNLASLTTLRLGGCAKLRSLPDSLGELTSLSESMSFGG
ncbi:hypothetical protein KI387_034282 [Taxus chinensis]|uniref:Nematode resistance-like protein n=1 Tax=Taxus chinensis TaxID=29808 RepID=A0AA38BVZ0_TAXCH|nr:hypothetical protein KI387_034282 [Taxus chinensis]